MIFKEAAMLMDGEKLIYNHGLSKNLEFSNSTLHFGVGLPFFHSKGDEAILSFYICEQTEQQW